MPWCEGCDRFYNPSTLGPDGTCQQCGRFIASVEDEPDEDDLGGRAPWHFYLLVAVVVIYLGWRLLQGIDWLIRQVF